MTNLPGVLLDRLVFYALVLICGVFTVLMSDPRRTTR